MMLTRMVGVGMSGQDVVRARRDRMASRPERKGLFTDLLLGIAAMAALACCAVLSWNWIMAGPPPVAPPSTILSSSSRLDWTAQDSATCENRANTAANEPLPAELVMADPVISNGGFARLTTRVTCRATLKVSRLCDPAQKAELVAQINDYVARHDIIVLGLDVQGAPMNIIGAFTGGEVAMGASMYDMTKADTLQYMAIYHDRLLARLHALAQGGVLSASDFGIFGLSVSPALAPAFVAVTPTTPICR